MKIALIACALLVITRGAQAQEQATGRNPGVTFDQKGITVRGTDSVTHLTFRFRIQQLFSAVTESESDYSIRSTQLAIRRMRLRFEGKLLDPRLGVSVQLSFARSDLDQEDTDLANVLRDAMVSWQFTPHFSIGAGQGKLPGNRQRLVSSADLQTPERSPVNSYFTVDRDVGIFATYARDVAGMPMKMRAAVSGGEGRNAGSGDDGLAYSGRVELLPLGAFTNGGDYVEGDLEREPETRLSLAVAASRNDRARRAGGQLGARLFSPVSMNTWFGDAMLKRSGFSLQVEYARRTAANAVTTRAGEDARYVFVGEGLMVQGSWLLPGKSIAPVVRYSTITPALPIRGLPESEGLDQAALGLVRFFNGHRIKMNGELVRSSWQLSSMQKRGDWTIRVGLEAGI